MMRSVKSVRSIMKKHDAKIKYVSASYFSKSNEQFNPDQIRACKVYLACCEREFGLPAICRTIKKLVHADKTDMHMYTVMGEHNWYVWRQIYADFVINEPWKP